MILINPIGSKGIYMETSNYINLLLALNEHLKNYKVLEFAYKELGLMPFNVITPSVISSLDKMADTNPRLIAEAVSFTEMVAFHGWFHGLPHISKELVNICVTARKECANHGSLQEQIMSEYFVQNDEEFLIFLDSNPFIKGVYFYTMLKTTVG